MGALISFLIGNNVGALWQIGARPRDVGKCTNVMRAVSDTSSPKTPTSFPAATIDACGIELVLVPYPARWYLLAMAPPNNHTSFLQGSDKIIHSDFHARAVLVHMRGTVLIHCRPSFGSMTSPQHEKPMTSVEVELGSQLAGLFPLMYNPTQPIFTRLNGTSSRLSWHISNVVAIEAP